MKSYIIGLMAGPPMVELDITTLDGLEMHWLLSHEFENWVKKATDKRHWCG